MKQRFRLFQRGSTFYYEDTEQRKQISLGTKDRGEALRLLELKRQCAGDQSFSQLLLRTCVSSLDPLLPLRTWQTVMQEMRGRCGVESTLARYDRAIKSKSFASLRNKKLLETTSADLMGVLNKGNLSTHHFLRRFHNFALGMGWIPLPILAPKLWPKMKLKAKRGVTLGEQEKILAAETNPERKLYYELLWEIGAAQSDAAALTAQQVDWPSRTLSYERKKTGTSSHLSIGARLEAILRRLPASGPLFPTLAQQNANERAAEFYRRCKLLGIAGISLHSYRYAWAERARTAGFPERFAQEALGHNSKAVHRAYAKGAQVKLPSLEEFERKAIIAK